MWTFLVRPECILCLSSALLVMGQLSLIQVPSFNHTYLTPNHLLTRKVGLRVEGSQFTLEGFPFLILAGTVHYFRVPRKYWDNRLKVMKDCGFNTLTTHVPWNLHEPVRGQFYFTFDLDLGSFLTTAWEAGLWVILCPGPYIGSDLDLGGLPSWLLRDPKMRLRTTYKGFTRAMNQYFNQLIPKIKSFQYDRGGPIIAVQVENEYGSYYLDRKYMRYVKKALVKRGINVMLMTADNGVDLKKGYLKNVLATVHMKKMRKQTYDDLTSIQGRSPTLMTLYTSSSFDTWGVLRKGVDPHILKKDMYEMLQLGFSINMYMFHGGTNFGFMGGAQFLNGYQAAVTNYDYSAPLTESGSYTPEYLGYQEFLQDVTGVSEYTKPNASVEAEAHVSVALLEFMSLWDVLPHLEKPTKSTRPLSMEQLPVNQGSGQSYGYTLYETSISTGGLLTSRGHVQDRALVFLDKKYLGVLDHSKDQLFISIKQGDSQVLRMLVENQGRSAYGKEINKERKGLTGDVYLGKSPLRKFTIYSLEMNTAFIKRKLPRIWKPVTRKIWGPAFFLGFLKVDDPPKDTFIKVEGWKKGVAFINGQNLGRYWSKGPQETLYVPGPWLFRGTNEIILFEEFEGDLEIQFTDEPLLGY